METVKRSVFARGWECRGIVRAQRIQGIEIINTMYNTITMDTSVINPSKAIECTTLRVNPNGNCGLCVTMMSTQASELKKKKKNVYIYIPIVGREIANCGGGYTYVGPGCIWKICAPSYQYSLNLKLF